MLNAITIPSYAKVRDSISGVERKIEVQPYTNYNVSVIDKSLKNNSYFSLINTNMTMFNDPFRANVTATDFQLRNKKKTFAVKGKGGISTRNENGKETGFFSGLSIDKNSGKLLYGISELIHSDKYNPNDLGYLQRNNDMVTETYVNYNIIEPFGIFREVHMNVWWDHACDFRETNTIIMSQELRAGITCLLTGSAPISGLPPTGVKRSMQTCLWHGRRFRLRMNTGMMEI
jgi:hypothetical protein